MSLVSGKTPTDFLRGCAYRYHSSGRLSNGTLRESQTCQIQIASPCLPRLTHRVFGAKSHGTIAARLVSVIFSWGANNVGVAYLMIGWLAMLLIVTSVALRQIFCQRFSARAGCRSNEIRSHRRKEVAGTTLGNIRYGKRR